MSKRRTPLQKLWLSATVDSCVGGTMRVTPKWPGKPCNPEDGGGPGIFTRMYAARQLQTLIRRHLKGGK